MHTKAQCACTIVGIIEQISKVAERIDCRRDSLEKGTQSSLL